MKKKEIQEGKILIFRFMFHWTRTGKSPMYSETRELSCIFPSSGCLQMSRQKADQSSLKAEKEELKGNKTSCIIYCIR